MTHTTLFVQIKKPKKYIIYNMIYIIYFYNNNQGNLQTKEAKPEKMRKEKNESESLIFIHQNYPEFLRIGEQPYFILLRLQ